jgi:2-dehydropantoate 2-reductase
MVTGGAEKVGKHNTSMLQDIDLGQLTRTPTPHIDSVCACVKLLAKTLGEEKGKLKIEKFG